jgi:hypothetical protein
MREVDQHLLSRALAIVRRKLPSSAWADFADAIAVDRSRHEAHLRKPEQTIDRSLLGEIDTFRSRALLKVPCGLDQESVTVLRRQLAALPVHRGPHVLSAGGPPRPLEYTQLRSQMAGYSMDQLLRTPGLVDLLNRPDIIDFIELYLGCVPTLYSVNAWWSFPADQPDLLHVQYFHRDTDDFRFCALFICLTDVNAATGPHQVITGSHTAAGMQRLLEQARTRGEDTASFDIERSFVDFFGQGFSARCERLFGDAIENVTGPAGTMFLVNTIALHRGLVPSDSPRLMIWARYGLGRNTNSADLEQGPLCRRQVCTALDDTPRNRYINRLLFEFDRGPY